MIKSAARLNISPDILLNMSFSEATVYINEASKQKRKDHKEIVTLAYSQVMWNRVSPEHIPKIEDLIGDEEFENQSKSQTVDEMEDVLRSFSVRNNASKSGKSKAGRRK